MGVLINFQKEGFRVNIGGPKSYVKSICESVNNNLTKLLYLGSLNLQKGEIVEFGAIHYSSPSSERHTA